MTETDIQRLERRIAELETQAARWRALAVAALRAWDGGCTGAITTEIMEQIRKESAR